jgi:hypothetical protein
MAGHGATQIRIFVEALIVQQPHLVCVQQLRGRFAQARVPQEGLKYRVGFPDALEFSYFLAARVGRRRQPAYSLGVTIDDFHQPRPQTVDCLSIIQLAHDQVAVVLKELKLFLRKDCHYSPIRLRCGRQPG